MTAAAIHLPHLANALIFGAIVALLVYVYGWHRAIKNAADGDVLGLESSGDVRWRQLSATVDQCRSDFDPLDRPLLDLIAANELRGFFDQWAALTKEQTT